MSPADREKYAAFLPPPAGNLPPGQYPPPKQPPVTHGARHPAIAKPLTGQALKDQARNVGQYAFDKLVIIGEEYSKNAGDWRRAFADVLAAYAIAITNMDSTLKDAEREDAKEAAWAAFVLSLFTAGAMRFLGAYVQYSVLPNVLSGKDQLLPQITLTPALAPVFKVVSVGEISKQYAAAFGGIAQDLGNRLIPRLLEASTVAGQPLNTLGGLEVLRTKFTKLLEEAAGMVLSDLTDAKNWIIEHDEFGSEWIAYSGGAVDAARGAIRDRLNKKRIEWGKDWDFYGKVPFPINQAQLAQHYERGLWIGYVGAILYRDFREVKVADHIAEVRRRSQGGNFITGYGEGPKIKVGVRVQAAIIRRLEELNVVEGETWGELIEQWHRMAGSQAPTPQVEVSGKLDTLGEYDSMKAWVDTGLPILKAQGDRLYFPPSKLRTFAPI